METDRERDWHRETGTERDRHRERQTQRETDTERDRHRDRQIERQTGRKVLHNIVPVSSTNFYLEM